VQIGPQVIVVLVGHLLDVLGVVFEGGQSQGLVDPGHRLPRGRGQPLVRDDEQLFRAPLEGVADAPDRAARHLRGEQDLVGPRDDGRHLFPLLVRRQGKLDPAAAIHLFPRGGDRSDIPHHRDHLHRPSQNPFNELDVLHPAAGLVEHRLALRKRLGKKARDESLERRVDVRLGLGEPLDAELLAMCPLPLHREQQVDQPARRRHVVRRVLPEQVHQQRRPAPRQPGNEMNRWLGHGAGSNCNLAAVRADCCTRFR
jgi:hypothetical protein